MENEVPGQIGPRTHSSKRRRDCDQLEKNVANSGREGTEEERFDVDSCALSRINNNLLVVAICSYVVQSVQFWPKFQE